MALYNSIITNELPIDHSTNHYDWFIVYQEYISRPQGPITASQLITLKPDLSCQSSLLNLRDIQHADLCTECRRYYNSIIIPNKNTISIV